MAAGKDFLNLYCYTGAFTCYAAKGTALIKLALDQDHIDFIHNRMNTYKSIFDQTQNLETDPFETAALLWKIFYFLNAMNGLKNFGLRPRADLKKPSKP